MQIDMHYYGTYALARAAGLNPVPAEIAATAAQFVDDMAGHMFDKITVSICFEDSGRIVSRPTAHHFQDIRNINKDDQRHVWVPFHFLPGNKGNDFESRLQCQMHSRIVQDMIAHHCELFDRENGLLLAGVTAHVLADTFSHYGFSGISSQYNCITNMQFQNVGLDMIKRFNDYEIYFKKNYKESCGANLWKRLISFFAETLSGALGHGAAITYPDLPFLQWSMEYEYLPGSNGEPMHRDNTATFLDGCEALYNLFVKVAQARPKDANIGVGFDTIRSNIRTIIGTQEFEREDRIALWQQAMQEGDLGPKEKIPPYSGEQWNDDLRAFHGTQDSTKCLDHPAYLFLQAASMHRNYVLRDLLPRHGLVVA